MIYLLEFFFSHFIYMFLHILQNFKNFRTQLYILTYVEKKSVMIRRQAGSQDIPNIKGTIIDLK